MGRNDAWSTAPQQAAIVTNIQAAVANLAPGVKFIVCTVTPGANEGPGTGNWTSLQALNALILAAFPSNTADIFAAVTAGGTANVPLANRAVTASTTGTWASASTSVTVASATGIVNGMFVLGAGIPTGTTCTISGTTLTLSAATTAAGSATALTFVGATEGHFNDIGYGVWKTTIQTLMTTLGM